MENKTFWFPHDSNARSDENITKLRIKWGNEGYGIYWCIVELLRDATAMRRQCDWDAIAYEVRCAASTAQSIVCDFDLFTVAPDGTTFWSESLLRRCSKTLELSEKNRINAQKRWSVKNATALPPHSDRIATAMHSTVQDSTVQDSTVQTHSSASPPVRDYPHDFLEWWDQYPKPEGKGQALKAWNSAKKKHGLEKIKTATQNYFAKLQAEGTATRFIKNPATFLNQCSDFFEGVIITETKTQKTMEQTRKELQDELISRGII